MTLHESSMIALAAAFAEHSCEDKPYVVVALDDHDVASTMGSYGLRRVANTRATRVGNQDHEHRVYVVCPHVGGGCVAMSGDYIMGKASVMPDELKTIVYEVTLHVTVPAGRSDTAWMPYEARFYDSTEAIHVEVPRGRRISPAVTYGGPAA